MALLGCLLAGSAQEAQAATAQNPLSRSHRGVSKETWLKDVQTVADEARPWVERRLADVPPGQHPAIVLDIDNTALATHFDPGAPVEAILAIARYAETHHAAVLFASYRHQDAHDKTVADLKNAGYPVDGLCLRPDGSSAGKAEVKRNCRIGYEKKGFTLTANIGNRDTDLQGGHDEKGFKLPDYDGWLS
ncbi:HAD family acid phosphatase [Streptomyces sp. CT34]|uniref:HAD family acid phosphatase n=1 Tax=Streptomyces sp. CT34 TaxID=1553907 RepID=UPI000AE11E2C|nr:HAD family acid phosphatase [Streptomyces sp. CT34]